MDNYTHVDYISISTKHANHGISPDAETTPIEYHQKVAASIFGAYPTFVAKSVYGKVSPGGGGAGYKFRLFFEYGGWTLFYGANHGHILLQMPGEACHKLREETRPDGMAVSLNPIFSSPHNKCTRIDIASNWRIPESPDEIAPLFKEKDITKYPRFPSETGITQYIGSPTSEKSLKVYRYFPPHPRHEWIRIEFRFNSPMAQQVQEAIPRGEMLAIYVGALLDWGFSHADMVNSINLGTEAISLAYKKRQDAGSLAWVYGTALAGVRDAIAAGDMNYEYACKFIKPDVE